MEQQEQQTAMYPICTLIKPDGTRCGSPALTGANFCFHHIGGRIPSQTRPNPETPGPYSPLDFVYPESRAAIQHNLFLVVQALNERKIDNRTANTFNRLFRACALNLRNAEAAKASIKLDETPQEQRSAASDQQHDQTQHTETTGHGENNDNVSRNNVTLNRVTRSSRYIDENSAYFEMSSRPDQAEGPAVRDESSASADGAHQATPHPYADLRRLPSPEYAYRVCERIAQRREAQREHAAGPLTRDDLTPASKRVHYHESLAQSRAEISSLGKA